MNEFNEMWVKAGGNRKMHRKRERVQKMQQTDWRCASELVWGHHATWRHIKHLKRNE